MMVIDNKFEIGEIVFLKTDIEQKPRMVTRIIIMPNGLTYELSAGTEDSSHFDFEITLEKNIDVMI